MTVSPDTTLSATKKANITECCRRVGPAMLTCWLQAELSVDGGCSWQTQIPTLSAKLMASRVALDLPSWAMHLALYRLIRMAIKMARKGGAFVCHHQFVAMHNRSLTTLLWSIKNKAEPHYCSLLCFNLVSIVWAPANGNGCHFGYHCQRRASNYCHRQRGSRNKLISPLVYWFY